MTRVAIIGAGLAGLTVARGISDLAEVTVFEKSRGLGGRLSTRYTGQWSFDHGAQYFTAHDPAFQKQVRALVDRGVVARWDARHVDIGPEGVIRQCTWGADAPRYVGMPRMSAVGRSLAQRLDLRRSVQVSRVERSGETWQLWAGPQDLGRFGVVILAVPPAQARALLQPDVRLTGLNLDAVDMQPCFALMLGFDQPQPWAFDAATIDQADIAWVAVNSSKPGRPDGYSLVVHSSNAWAAAHLNDAAADVRHHLAAELGRTTGLDAAMATHIDLQRWRYANVARQSGPACWFDPALKLGMAGDWFLRGRVEAAFLSGRSLIQRLERCL